MAQVSAEFKTAVGFVVLLVITIGVLLNQAAMQKEIMTLQRVKSEVIIQKVFAPTATPSATLAPVRYFPTVTPPQK